jgi:ligand-binding sensor domain-containing protein
MKTSLLTVFFLSALLVQTIGYAADNPAYTCRWYFIRQCGTGHAGGVEFIQKDDSGNIWTGAGGPWSSSLWRFDGKQWQETYSVGREGSSLYSAAYRENDGLYVATEQGLLHIRNDLLMLNTQMYIVHSFGPSFFGWAINAFFNAVPTKLVYLDKRDDLWVYAPNIGLFRHTGGIWNEHTTYWPQDGGRKKLIDLLDGISVTSLHAVSMNIVVVGGSTGNLYFLKQKTSSHGGRGTDIKLVSKHTAKTIGIPEGARITSITSDSEGCVWIAYGKGDADGGVACLRENECEVFSHMNSDIPKRPITAIACLPNGRIMAGVDWNDPTVGGAPQGVTYDKTGLLEFVAGKWQFVEVEGFSASAGRVIDHGPDEPKEVGLYNESYRWINFIWPDSRGNIWVGTQAGLARFAPVKRRQTARKGTQPATAADGEDAATE